MRSGLSMHGRGAHYSLLLLGALLRESAWTELILAMAEIGVKFAGYKLGRLERFLPLALKRVMSLHRAFWMADASRG